MPFVSPSLSNLMSFQLQKVEHLLVEKSFSVMGHGPFFIWAQPLSSFHGVENLGEIHHVHPASKGPR